MSRIDRDQYTVGAKNCAVGDAASSDGALAMHDLVDPTGRHPDRNGELVLGDAEPPMTSSIRISPGWTGSIRSAFDEFGIVCTSIPPGETHTPLCVHADVALPAPVADETLQDR